MMKQRKHYLFFNEGSKINQVICAILINLPVFAYGMTIGWMSPMVLLLQSKRSPTGIPLSDTEVSWMAAVAYIVCVPANYIISYIGDKFGRKKAVMILSFATACVWITKLSSLQPWAFIVARVLVGIPAAGCYVACPMYTKEISEDSIRGVLGTLVILFHTTGNLFLYVIGDFLSYYTVLWICLSVPVIHMLVFWVVPESPSYLVKTGQQERATKVLAWLRCRSPDDATVKRELDLIKKEQEQDEGGSEFVLKAVLSDKIMSRAFRIAMVAALAREVCGAIPVVNFAGDIFSNASKGTGLVLTPNQQAMMLGAVQVAGSALASSIVEKAGRKPLLFITSLVSGTSMCVLATWFMLRSFGHILPTWLPIVTLCLCIFCDSAGLAPVSVVVGSEMFSFKYRGTVMATTMSTASFADFIQMLFFKKLTTAIGPHVAFYFFGIVCLIAAIYFILVMPETKQRSLEEIYSDLMTKKEKNEVENITTVETYKQMA